MLHAAAINIGECAGTTDFIDFAMPGSHNRLDANKYLDAMGRLFENVFEACRHLDVQDIVWFPIGAGAFLRNLSDTDTDFANFGALLELRRGIAKRFVAALAGAHAQQGRMKLHLLISFETMEAAANADGFIRALADCESMRAQVVLHPDGESMHLGHELAAQGSNVAVLNGANRQLLGNHWFSTGARRAIDENLHRRSVSLAAISYLLNDFDSSKMRPLPQRRGSDLAKRVQQLGGKVVPLRVCPGMITPAEAASSHSQNPTAPPTITSPTRSGVQPSTLAVQLVEGTLCCADPRLMSELQCDLHHFSAKLEVQAFPVVSLDQIQVHGCNSPEKASACHSELGQICKFYGFEFLA